MPNDPTMTPEEVSNALRELGVKTSPDKIRAGIQQGAYPFGVAIQLTVPTYEIYRKLFYEWLNSHFSMSGVESNGNSN